MRSGGSSARRGTNDARRKKEISKGRIRWRVDGNNAKSAVTFCRWTQAQEVSGGAASISWHSTAAACSHKHQLCLDQPQYQVFAILLPGWPQRRNLLVPRCPPPLLPAPRLFPPLCPPHHGSRQSRPHPPAFPDPFPSRPPPCSPCTTCLVTKRFAPRHQPAGATLDTTR